MPIVLDNASRVLAINHVFDLLVRVQGSGDWADAAACLPGRKLGGGEADADDAQTDAAARDPAAPPPPPPPPAADATVS